MSYKVDITTHFSKQAKHLLKKYPSLKGELNLLIGTLENNPLLGQSIGNNCYKIRLSIASKNKGKSGGARVITYVHFSDEKVYLLSIYDKSEIGSLSSNELTALLKVIPSA